MKLIKTLTWSAAFAAGLFIGGLAGASAQQPDQSRGQAQDQDHAKPSTPDQSRQDRDRAPEPAAITGELTRVNPQSMTFSVKSASGAEMLFKYDEKTIVTGSESNVAGLATSNGSEVTVSYRNDTAGNMASKIEVHAKR
jgi:hypothetical protein